MSYLVTGGSGFIGSNIVKELVKIGEDVKVIDNLAGYFEMKASEFIALAE